MFLRKCHVCGFEATNEAELNHFVPQCQSLYKRSNLCKKCSQIQCGKKRNKKVLTPCECGCGALVLSFYKHGHGRRGKHNSQKHNEAIIKALTGRKVENTWNKGKKGVFHHSPESIDLMRKRALELGFGKWMNGKKLSSETIEKIRSKLIGHSTSDSTKKKISEANKGINNGMYGRVCPVEEKQRLSEIAKKLWKNPSYREPNLKNRKVENLRKGAIIAGRNVKLKDFCNSKPELKMKKILSLFGFKFIHLYDVWTIEHIYTADFFIPKYKLIIEVDGVYYHNYPTRRPIDVMRNVELVDDGFKVIRFWEYEVTEECFKRKMFPYIHALNGCSKIA